MTKTEAIRSFEFSGYKYLGFKDIGWGQKYYHFLSPPSELTGCSSTLTYDLRNMRIKAEHLEYKRWSDKQLSELEFGIQQELELV